VDAELRSTLVKVALPLLVIVLTLFASLVASKKRGLSLRDLGFAWPKPSSLFLWLAVWIGWMFASEIAIHALDMETAKPWPAYSPAVLLLRIAAIGILGPAAEELLVRGILFFLLTRKWSGPCGAIVICAAGWAAMHYRYDWKTVSLIFLDGVILGAARYQSRSIYVPIVMHVLGNLFSIYQSLS
jgi:membrane protease YdiL (CAAX protease family)